MANRTRSWTDAQLISAVNNNVTYAGVLRELGLAVGGYNTKYIKKHISRLLLDTSHFNRRTGKLNSGCYKRRPIQDVLSVEINSYRTYCDPCYDSGSRVVREVM